MKTFVATTDPDAKISELASVAATNHRLSHPENSDSSRTRRGNRSLQ